MFFDEVHKYPDWSKALKNIYDDYLELHIAFTGSSLLEILNARSDLSRRALVYNIQGLSFFEVGGKNKKRKQIKEIPDSFILADDIEFGTDRRIPLWLLGFLY
nr:AAA family ATPase [Treponema sp.]